MATREDLKAAIASLQARTHGNAKPKAVARKPRPTRMGYRAAIKWLADNDDCEWCSKEESAQSVTASFVADCFGVDDDKVRRDLLRQLKKTFG